MSVFMITYNHEKYIRQAVESILSQETDFRFELVIGDDCSTDSTPQILQEYAEKHPDIIRLKINDRNVGMIANYFSTVSRCRGKYIALCAGDDWWLPGKAAMQVAYLEENPDTGMVYTRTRKHYDNKKIFDKRPDFFGGPWTTYEGMHLNNPIPSVTVMARRSLVERYVEEIDPVNRDWLTEDFPMWLWFAQNDRIGFIDEVTTVWRIWRGSLSHSKAFWRVARFRRSVTDAAYFFALRHYGSEKEMPPDLVVAYYYRAVVEEMAATDDFNRLEKYREKICYLHDRFCNSRTRKMTYALKFPRIYSLVLRNYKSLSNNY